MHRAAPSTPLAGDACGSLTLELGTGGAGPGQGRAGHSTPWDACASSGWHSHVVQVPGAEEDPALPVPVGVDGVFGDTVIHVERTLGRKMTGEAMR